MKILVLPDIHGRDFWREPCQNIEEYDKIVFLGDYLDPYGFEEISVEKAIDNFKDILLFAKDNPKVVMLLGNHDMPYFSSTYYGFSTYHCRISTMHYKEIHGIFKEHEDLFKIAHHEGDVLFTHAGCLSEWLSSIFDKKYDEKIDLDELCKELNDLPNETVGLNLLYMVSSERGGCDEVGSCIWANWNEMQYDSVLGEVERHYAIHDVKQVFGHTLQAFISSSKVIEKENGSLKLVQNYGFGKALEFKNIKMIDTGCAYELETEEFTINKISK